jgi:hypothetical protein
MSSEERRNKGMGAVYGRRGEQGGPEGTDGSREQAPAETALGGGQRATRARGGKVRLVLCRGRGGSKKGFVA